MKKRSILFATALLFMSFVFSQEKLPEWKELQRFHDLISKTFHPTEKGNFLPLKENADSLLLAAEAWQTSTVPVNLKKKGIEKQLLTLVKQSLLLKQKVIKKNSDVELKKTISSIHETFHKIVEEAEKK